MQFPLDGGDAIAYAIGAVVMFLGYFVTKRSKSESSEHVVMETVDEGVLTQFQALNDRLTKLELELAETRTELIEVRRERDNQIEALRELYTDALEEKDKEIKSLSTSLENHRRRIKQLEEK
jgi:chromosome segregation ATPase